MQGLLSRPIAMFRISATPGVADQDGQTAQTAFMFNPIQTTIPPVPSLSEETTAPIFTGIRGMHDHNEWIKLSHPGSSRDWLKVTGWPIRLIRLQWLVPLSGKTGADDRVIKERQREMQC
jgi:hypothetical protein